MLRSLLRTLVLFVVIFGIAWAIQGLPGRPERSRADAPIPAFATWRYGLAKADAAKVSGRVVDGHDAPIADVEVWLLSHFDDHSSERVATTDGDGRYDVPFVRPAEYRIAFCRDGWLPQVRHAQLAKGATDIFDLQWRDDLALTIRVVDAQLATPIEGAIVHAYEAVGSRGGMDQVARMLDDDPQFFAATAMTDATGSAIVRGLRPGPHDLAIASPRHAPACAVAQLASGVDPASVTVELTTGASITGRVRQNDGTPAGGAQVLLTSVERWPTRIDDFAIAHTSVVADASGEFVFDRLRPGTYHAIALAKDGSFGFSIRDGELLGVPVERGRDATIDLELRRPIARVSGVVRDVDGRPIEGAKVSLETVDLHPHGAAPFRLRKLVTSPWHKSTTDAAGRYEFTGVRRGWRTLVGEVAAPGHDDVTFELDTRTAVGELQHDITVEPLGDEIVGRVRDADGTPRADVRIVAVPQPSKRPIRSARTDTNGNYRIAVPTGESNFEVRVDDTAEMGVFALPDRHRGVVAGARADFDLLAARVVTGTVVDGEGRPVSDCMVALFDPAEHSANMGAPTGIEAPTPSEANHTDASGRFRVLLDPEAATANMMLVLHSPTQGMRVMQMASLDLDARDLRIQFPTTTTLRGRLVDAAGAPIVGAQIAAEATPFTGMPGEATHTAGDGTFAVATSATTGHLLAQQMDDAGILTVVRLPLPDVGERGDLELALPSTMHDVELRFVSTSGASIDGNAWIMDELGPVLAAGDGVPIGAGAVLRLRLATGDYSISYVRQVRPGSTELPTLQIEVPADASPLEFRVP